MLKTINRKREQQRERIEKDAKELEAQLPMENISDEDVQHVKMGMRILLAIKNSHLKDVLLGRDKADTAEEDV